MGQSQNRVICVLGMHRSGTSLLTRCLNILGLTLGNGKKIMPPGPDNPTGFWEHSEIVAIHDQLLAALGRNWADSSPMPNNWTELPAARFHKTFLRRLCTEEFGRESIWAFKDPRTSLLLPLWKELFADLGLAPSYLIVVRNPKEVADSLAKRNGFAQAESLVLWRRYNLEIVQHTEGSPRLVVEYTTFLRRWKLELERIKEKLALPNVRDQKSVEADLAAVVNPGLRHHGGSGPEEVPSAVAETYRLLSAAAAGETNALRLLLRKMTTDWC